MPQAIDHPSAKRSITGGLALGALGGAVLVFSEKLARGPFILVPYALLLVAIAVLLRSERVASFSNRFSTSLIAFTTASAMLYLFLQLGGLPGVSHSIPFWGHAWRIGFLIGSGSGLSLAIAELTRPDRFRAQRNEPAHLL